MGSSKTNQETLVPLLSSHCIQTLHYHPVYYSFYACRVLIKQRLPGQMSEATQRGKSEGNCRTSQGSKFFFPTFPYLLLVVCSEAVLACFRGYGLWAHAWYLCHFHGSKKKSLLFSILGGKKIKEEFPICKLTYAHMSLL